MSITTKAEQEMRERFAKRLSEYSSGGAYRLLRIESPEELALLRPLVGPAHQKMIDTLIELQTTP